MGDILRTSDYKVTKSLRSVKLSGIEARASQYRSNIKNSSTQTASWSNANYESNTP